jgi:hypothetical protein
LLSIDMLFPSKKPPFSRINMPDVRVPDFQGSPICPPD